MFIDSGIKMIIVIKTEAKILDTVPTVFIGNLKKIREQSTNFL